MADDAGEEDFERHASVHVAALVGPFFVVGFKPAFEIALHFLDALPPGLPALDAQEFIEQRAVESLDEAVALGPAHAGGAVRGRVRVKS